MCLGRYLHDGGTNCMANGDMALQNVLPESVNERRMRLRQRFQSLREPIRSRREQLVPGPDLVGSVEERLMQARSQVMQRDNILQRIRQRRDGGGSGGSGGDNNNSGGGQNRNSEFQ